MVGYEVARTVEAVGDGVDRTGSADESWPVRIWWLLRIVNVAATDSVVLPDALSFPNRTAVPVYATAWAALHGYRSLRAGEQVLIHAAAVGRHRGGPIRESKPRPEVHGTRITQNIRSWPSSVWTARSTPGRLVGLGPV